jgi:DNA mismatch repair protein MutS
MINTQDLHIEEEIKPLFDLTYNPYSGAEVKDILTKTLPSKEAIFARQELLKGFIANREILKDYSYYRFNLAEIYEFLETIFVGSVSAGNMRLKFMFSDKEREKKRGKLILLVRLFYAINTDYLSKIDTSVFPATYATELEELKKFFAAFDLERYETAFNKNKFGTKHMVELMLIITAKIGTGESAAFWKRWFLFEAYLSVSTGIATHGFVTTGIFRSPNSIIRY